MRALVTGATGFVGRHLVAGLLDRGWEVCAMVRPGTQLSHAPHGVGIVTGDLLVPTTLGVEASATGPLDVVFHCAALLPSAAGCDPAQFLAANATATELLLNACERRSIRRFVYLSSIAVIGHPSVVPIDEHHPTAPATPYAVGKLGGEQACERARTRGMLAASLRLSSPYGPGMALGSVLPLFVHRALRGEPLAWHGSGSRSQDFIHVEDVVSACIGAATAGA
ncbi:MAG TPA: hypothetical protein DCM86_17995, partial [Verrucomicrobiales bacterium]|nr:hypothetical protein [Verrucomicrobiales bacterium]